MSKLLFIFERNMPSISITKDVFTNLKIYSDIKTRFVFLTDVTTKDIDECDIIIFMRPNDIYSWKIAMKARQAGHLVITFCDDDLLNLPPSLPTIPWRKRGLVKCLANSDIIWSSSQYILDKYKKMTAGKRSATIDTIVRPEEFEGIILSRLDDNIKIVYAASPSHAKLFEEYVSPVVPKLVKEFGCKIQFTFVSVHPTVNGTKCEYLAGMPLSEYRKYMKNQHFDIGLAPLHNDEFSKCKYYNKFLEYTTHGIVGVYSKTEPYTHVIRNGENGFLCTDDPEDWYQVLKNVIKNSLLRKKCVENAINYIKREHSEDACIKRICNGIPEILDVQGDYSRCKNFWLQKIEYYILKPFDWGYLLGFYIKHTGIRAVIHRVQRHFIEAKAYSRRNTT